MEGEDINKIVNVFSISFVHDEALTQQESMTSRTFFSDFVNTTSLTNFIIKEYILEDLYDYHVDIKYFNKLLHNIGSSYSIEEFDERKWLYLSQDECFRNKRIITIHYMKCITYCIGTKNPDQIKDSYPLKSGPRHETSLLTNSIKRTKLIV